MEEATRVNTYEGIGLKNIFWIDTQTTEANETYKHIQTDIQ